MKVFIIQPPDENHCLSSLLECFSSCYFQGMVTTNEIHSRFLKDSITTSGLTWLYLRYHKVGIQLKKNIMLYEVVLI